MSQVNLESDIKVRNLSRIYSKASITIPAIHDVTFDIKKGEFVSIVGKSGSGKSTLLNLIAGLDKPTSGTIIFEGNDMAKMSRYKLALHRRFSVGMIFQSFNLIPSRSAIENIILALAFGGIPRKERKSIAVSLLKSVGLDHRLHHLPNELSGGEAQRVAIARALANNPEVILADEPTGNLDSITSKEIMDMLIKLNKEHQITILMVTHDKETAETCSDKIIRLKDGSIIRTLN
ncbi:MAG: ABC transporter ATP-binding protein [Bacteroidales bacterium]|nr:ABC transporter ATP-binding protein [Bacteroidales bacterium]